MDNLKQSIETQFKDGYFVVRRTDQYYSAISPDYAIETSLMSSFKGRQGLTHGRSLTQMNCLVWILSRPLISHLRLNLKDFAIDQRKHKLDNRLCSETTVKRDYDSMTKMENYASLLDLEAIQNSINTSIMNIATGTLTPTGVKSETTY